MACGVGWGPGGAPGWGQSRRGGGQDQLGVAWGVACGVGWGPGGGTGLGIRQGWGSGSVGGGLGVACGVGWGPGGAPGWGHRGGGRDQLRGFGVAWGVQGTWLGGQDQLGVGGGLWCGGGTWWGISPLGVGVRIGWGWLGGGLWGWGGDLVGHRSVPPRVGVGIGWGWPGVACGGGGTWWGAPGWGQSHLGWGRDRLGVAWGWPVVWGGDLVGHRVGESVRQGWGVQDQLGVAWGGLWCGVGTWWGTGFRVGPARHPSVAAWPGGGLWCGGGDLMRHWVRLRYRHRMQGRRFGELCWCRRWVAGCWWCRYRRSSAGGKCEGSSQWLSARGHTSGPMRHGCRYRHAAHRPGCCPGCGGGGGGGAGRLPRSIAAGALRRARRQVPASGCALRVEGMEEPEVPAPASDVPECVEVHRRSGKCGLGGLCGYSAPPWRSDASSRAARAGVGVLGLGVLVSESLASAELDASPCRSRRYRRGRCGPAG